MHTHLEVVKRGPKQIYCEAVYVGDAFLQHYGPSNLDLITDGIEALPLKYSKKKFCISHQFRAGIQTCGPTSIHSRRRRNRDWRLRSKMPDCCPIVAAASTVREMRSSSESASHHHLQLSLDWTGRANGLSSQVAGPRTNGLLPLGSH